MILRRFVDLLIVIVGVLFALFIWSGIEKTAVNKKTRADETRLAAEFKQEVWISAYMLQYWEEVLANARWTEAALDSKEMSDEAFLIAAYRASQYTWWNRRRAAFDELASTGAITRLRSGALRKGAFFTYSSTLLKDVADRGAASQYRAAFRMSVPTDVQDALAAACGDADISVGDALDAPVLDYPCSPDIAAAAVSAAANALRANQEVAPALRLRVATLETDLADLREYDDMMQSFASS